MWIVRFQTRNIRQLLAWKYQG